MKKIAIIGSGTMGHGIALVSAIGGYEVIMIDTKKEFIENGITKIKEFLSKSVQKKKMTRSEGKKVLSMIKGAIKLEEVKNCDIVIESIVENVELKKKILEELDNLCPKKTIFASNTSTISITELAAATKRPDSFIGIHFMNPVPIIKLVEIIKGLKTSDETTETVKKFTKKIGKTPIEINDSTGFVSNRILIPMINEAIYCLMEGVATKKAIDDIMKIGMNHSMGPLEIADLIGLDTCLYIMEELYRGFSDSKYRPCPLLKKMVNAGYLGKKTGKGFYNYAKN